MQATICIKREAQPVDCAVCAKSGGFLLPKIKTRTEQLSKQLRSVGFFDDKFFHIRDSINCHRS